MAGPSSDPLALKIPTDGSTAELVRFNVKYRNTDDGGHGEFFDENPDLRQWYGNAFLERRFSDLCIGNVASPKSPRFIKSDEIELHGLYCLYYNLSSVLPINETCLKYVGAKPSHNRIFWRGDLFLIKYEGELGMGHKYVDI